MKYFLIVWLCLFSSSYSYEFTKPDGTKIELTVVDVQKKEYKKKTSWTPADLPITKYLITDPITRKRFGISKVVFISQNNPEKQIITDIDKLTEEDAILIREWHKNRNDYIRNDNKWVKMGRTFFVQVINIQPDQGEKIIRVDDDIIWVNAYTEKRFDNIKRSFVSDKHIVAIKIPKHNYSVGDRIVCVVRQIGIVKRDGGDFPLCIQIPKESVCVGEKEEVVGKQKIMVGVYIEREKISFDEYVKNKELRSNDY